MADLLGHTVYDMLQYCRSFPPGFEELAGVALFAGDEVCRVHSVVIAAHSLVLSTSREEKRSFKEGLARRCNFRTTPELCSVSWAFYTGAPDC